MTSTLAEFTAKFRVAELEIVRTTFWTWSVRPVQTTVGAGILSLNRFATSLADLTEQEAADLAVIVPVIEASLRTFAAPEKFNYLALMMIDAHVHFHVLPRYSEMRELAGHTWADNGWPAMPALADHADLSTTETLVGIRDALRTTWR